jgi:hypothetical protein
VRTLWTTKRSKWTKKKTKETYMKAPRCERAEEGAFVIKVRHNDNKDKCKAEHMA